KKNMTQLGQITFVSNQLNDVQSLYTDLEEHGAQVSLISAQELDLLADTSPDIIIIGADTKGIWQDMPSTELSQLFENHKLIGFGRGGEALFFHLGLELGSSMGSKNPQVIVEHSELLCSPLSISNNLVEVYQPSEAYVLGVFDGFNSKENGSLANSGFEGIAHFQRGHHHWPIARQGNYVLWGFDSPTDQMTDAGRQLFVNLLAHHKARPSVPLSQARKQPEYIKPGLLSDDLTERYNKSVWNFQVNQVGQIRADLWWHPVDQELALVLNGPGQVGFYARVDGTSPQVIVFDVEEKHLARGTDWCISVVCFGFGCIGCEEMGCDLINFKLQLEFERKNS
ncbi:hypothetical protein IH992_31225, partial [Candidatus Poribacteria bacterium]|nr:hypothetical protein [Candidatus Poribacteria bacterium]